MAQPHITDAVLEMLIPIFPNLTRDVLETSVHHPSNHDVPLSVQVLLQKCIDDLLELRTFTEKTYREPAMTINSDDSIDSDIDDMLDDYIVSLKSASSSDNIPVKIHTSDDVKIKGHIPSKIISDDVVITDHTPAKDCLIVAETPPGIIDHTPAKDSLIVAETPLGKQGVENVQHIKPLLKGATFVAETSKKLNNNEDKVSNSVNIGTKVDPKKSSAKSTDINGCLKSNDDIYREIEFSSDSNSSNYDLPTLNNESSDNDDDLPVLISPTKNSLKLRPSKFNSPVGKPINSPDFHNWRDTLQDQKPGTSAVNTDKFILQGRNKLLGPSRSQTGSKLSTDGDSTEHLLSKSYDRGVTATVNVSNTSDVNVNITVNVSAHSDIRDKSAAQNDIQISNKSTSEEMEIDVSSVSNLRKLNVPSTKLSLQNSKSVDQQLQSNSDLLQTELPNPLSGNNIAPKPSVIYSPIKNERLLSSSSMPNVTTVNSALVTRPSLTGNLPNFQDLVSTNRIAGVPPVANIAQKQQHIPQGMKDINRPQVVSLGQIFSPRFISPIVSSQSSTITMPQIAKVADHKFETGYQLPIRTRPQVPLARTVVATSTIPVSLPVNTVAIQNRPPLLPPFMVATPALQQVVAGNNVVNRPAVSTTTNPGRAHQVVAGNTVVNRPAVSTTTNPGRVHQVVAGNYVVNRPAVSTTTNPGRVHQVVAGNYVVNRPPITTATNQEKAHQVVAGSTVVNRPLIPTATNKGRVHQIVAGNTVVNRPPITTATNQEKVMPPAVNEVTVTTDIPVINIDDKPDNTKLTSIANTHISTPVVIPDDDLTPEMKKAKCKDNLRKEVVIMFPDVDPTFVDQQYDRFQNCGWEVILNNVCNILLENPQYPKKHTHTSLPTSTKPSPCIDYYKEYSSFPSGSYRNQCEMLLQTEFMWISLKDIRNVMKCFNERYAPSHKVLTSVMKNRREEYGKTKDSLPFSPHPYSQAKTEIKINGVHGERTMMITFLKCGRPHRSMKMSVCPELILEQEFIKTKAVEEAKELDHMLAVSVNDNEYEESGQLIECGCCYGEIAFENMIQCYEGHLFCRECLHRYAQESVFGHGKANLVCMTDACDATYPISQLQKALPSNILSKYEDRVQEENINLADLADLVRCPSCDFAALLDPADKVFKCHNQSCLKETCRYCKEDWTEHFGKRCEEIEKKDEVKLRLQFEEKMTEAKIRACHKCKAKFTKSDGCNKMTCRCGAKMCYICRLPNIDYEHFCRHFRDPSKGAACQQCKACSLWTNPEEDDERAVAEIRKEAGKTRKAMGYEDEKLIGAPDEPPSKKQKTLPPVQHPQLHMQMV